LNYFLQHSIPPPNLFDWNARRRLCASAYSEALSAMPP
jgi:hypothetical protein